MKECRYWIDESVMLSVKLNSYEELDTVAHLLSADVGSNGDVWIDVTNYKDNCDEERSDIVDYALAFASPKTETLQFWR